MTRRAGLLLWAVGLEVLLVPTQGVAQTPGDVPRPLVLDMTTLSPQPRTDAVQALVSEYTPFEPGTYPLLSGASPEFLELFRWVYPADEHLTCPEDLQNLPETLDQARGLVVELELDRALVMLRKAFETLPCQHEAMSRDMLRRIFYYEGIARYYEGDETGSLRAFLASLAIDPQGEALPGFPPEITTAFQEATQRLDTLPEVSLALDPELKQAHLHIDGEPIPDLEDHTVLRVGFHVAQVFNADGVARTGTFFLDNGESRPLSAIVDLMPPGSTSYLNAVFRTAIQQSRLDPAQESALDAYCRLNHYPFIIMAVVSVETGEQTLITYVPHRGLIQGVPEGLEPLPPMVAPEQERESPRLGWFARRRQRKAEAAKAQQARAQTDESGISFGGSATRPVATKTPEAGEPHGEPAPQHEAEQPRTGRPRRSHPAAKTVARLQVGSTSYQGDLFGGVQPSATLPLAGPLGVHVALFYGTDFGARTETLLNLVGLRLGLEPTFPMGTLSLRLGFGGALTTARVVTTGPGVTELLIEGTPETWVGLDYLLDDHMMAGFEIAGGFSPGITAGAAAHGLWRAGIAMGWAF